jgi:hypothetical protein
MINVYTNIMVTGYLNENYLPYLRICMRIQEQYANS